MTWLRIVAAALVVMMGGCSRESVTARRPPSGALTIYSTTDTSVFAPVIDDFQRLNPKVRMTYVELEARPLHERYLRESAAGTHRADILLSASMDLQVKLVNDGYALRHRSANAKKLPAWARWRDEIFGVTFEPVVIAYNPDLLGDREMPRTRFGLVQALRADPAFWRGRVGTYDVAESNVGYLLATQDARLSSEFGPLTEAIGSVDPRTYKNTASLLTDIESGRVALGYNVLGSYARRRIDAGARLAIVYPEDYTLAVVRAAIIPKDAPNAGAAHAFLEYLLSLRGQRILSTRSHLAAAREEIGGPYGRLGLAGAAVGPLRPIPIGPGLLVYLDAQKKERFIENWRGMMESSRQGDGAAKPRGSGLPARRGLSAG